MEACIYILQAPFFWGTMGFITAISMFIGVMVYDGKMSEVSKGLVSVGTYALMLLWVTAIRISNVNWGNNAQALAGIATIIFVTLFWSLGMFLGVMLAYVKGWKK